MSSDDRPASLAVQVGIGVGFMTTVAMICWPHPIRPADAQRGLLYVVSG